MFLAALPAHGREVFVLMQQLRAAREALVAAAFFPHTGT